MHEAVSTEQKIVGQKAAQMGYTEWAMNTSFFSMDVLGRDVLYILPTESDASDFSAGRFDPALEESPHLRDFFADVNNVGLKRAGTNILYVRGSHSRSKLKSIPTPVIVFDEVDEMPKASISLAEERQSGQVDTLTLMLSTPTLDDFGINGEFKLSSQDYYFFKCPHCSRHINLTFPDCLKVTAETLTDPGIKDSYYFCPKCEHKLETYTLSNGIVHKPWLTHRDFGGSGHFVPSFADRDARGFHVSQMYSMAKVGHPAAFAIAYLKSLLDPTREQEFHNSKVGVTHAVQGAKVNDTNLRDCTGQYHKGPKLNFNSYRTMGIDVGAVLHIVVKEFTDSGILHPGIGVNDRHNARILYEGTSTGASNDFDEAYKLFFDYKCQHCVIDAEPERRAAMQFAQRLWGHATLCDYLFSQHGREIQYNEEEGTVKGNRTAWMDMSLGRYKNGTVKIPIDTSLDFKKQVKEPTRIYKEDKYGNKFGVYENVNADHFAHADTYAEMALPLACGVGQTQTIQ
jgi:hypothetical protein